MPPVGWVAEAEDPLEERSKWFCEMNAIQIVARSLSVVVLFSEGEGTNRRKMR
jgi:hypothetical protein